MRENKTFNCYEDYFSKANSDFAAAEDKFEEENLESACSLLQEAVWKYLTGYSLYKAESVKEIQEISQLFGEAETCNDIFKKYQLLCGVGAALAAAQNNRANANNWVGANNRAGAMPAPTG